MSWPPPRKLPWLLLISLLALAADRITKIWVSARIPFGGAIPVIDHVLRFSHWTNEGAAFSMFADTTTPQAVRWGLVAFASLAAIVVLIAMVRLGDKINLTTVALALILGGALGNVYDRIVYGSVIDFIEVHIYHYHYPDFNIADSCVVVGACLLFLDSLFPRRQVAA